MEAWNTLIVGRGLIKDPRFPALVKVLEFFHVQCIKILYRDGDYDRTWDSPECLRSHRCIEEHGIIPVNSRDITPEAVIDPPLELFGGLYVQANPDLCTSVLGTPSPEKSLYLHKHFPKGMRTVHTIGEFQKAIHAAFVTMQLMNPQLRPAAPTPPRRIPPSWKRHWEREREVGRGLVDPLGIAFGRGEVQRPDFVPGPVSPPAEETPRNFATRESDDHWDDVAAELGVRPQKQ